jgi:hypothetical protein
VTTGLLLQYAKAWAANGAIMEDIITNFELVGTRLLRICPCCNELQREQCPTCGFHFPYLTDQPSSFAVFKDAALGPTEGGSNGIAHDRET